MVVAPSWHRSPADSWAAPNGRGPRRDHRDGRASGHSGAPAAL